MRRGAFDGTLLVLLRAAGRYRADLFDTIVAQGRSFPAIVAASVIAGLVTGLIGYAAYVPMSQSLLSIPVAVTQLRADETLLSPWCRNRLARRGSAIIAT